MPVRVRIEINHAGVAKTLRGAEIERLMLSMGQSIGRAAGPGHKVTLDRSDPRRSRVEVVTDTIDAVVAEAYHRTLTRAVQAGRR